MLQAEQKAEQHDPETVLQSDRLPSNSTLLSQTILDKLVGKEHGEAAYYHARSLTALDIVFPAVFIYNLLGLFMIPSSSNFLPDYRMSIRPESGASMTTPRVPEQSQSSRPERGLSLCMPRPTKKAQYRRFFQWKSIKKILVKFFGSRTRVLPQPQSLFLTLPLEIRHMIFMYVFASSMIHERDNNSLSTWDHLLLSCRQVKIEMESMPAQPIISLVNTHWRKRFPNHPLNISAVTKNGVVQDLVVAIPRAVLQPAYRKKIRTYIPDYISPLFRIYADTLTLMIHDDGSPLVNMNSVPVYEHMLRQILSTLWARERTLPLLAKKCRVKILPPPPSRNYFNAKKVVVNWQGSLSGTLREHFSMLLWIHLLWIASKPFRRGIHLRKRRFVLDWVSRTYFTIEAVKMNGLGYEKGRFHRPWALGINIDIPLCIRSHVPVLPAIARNQVFQGLQAATRISSAAKFDETRLGVEDRRVSHRGGVGYASILSISLKSKEPIELWANQRLNERGASHNEETSRATTNITLLNLFYNNSLPPEIPFKFLLLHIGRIFKRPVVSKVVIPHCPQFSSAEDIVIEESIGNFPDLMRVDNENRPLLNRTTDNLYNSSITNRSEHCRGKLKNFSK
ncbi:uncharacterized protein BDR25DRAFT_349044 [Lindgomyces ingoldianus]|uniref:Uncharacterized protein n=1 Tax=Lindgomyces ingoldianus TaxID=673940 RepID=A0ACB6RD86_9PLEO|nr:uncharacterized protein BDR25DRAFT_349044 [Lindgomyces ingoldianus]KAF2477151.1 hypothetical protein BDR25DRAFT_349044 [Lindgomyces ingoldianus]